VGCECVHVYKYVCPQVRNYMNDYTNILMTSCMVWAPWSVTWAPWACAFFSKCSTILNVKVRSNKSYSSRGSYRETWAESCATSSVGVAPTVTLSGLDFLVARPLEPVSFPPVPLFIRLFWSLTKVFRCVMNWLVFPENDDC